MERRDQSGADDPKVLGFQSLPGRGISEMWSSSWTVFVHGSDRAGKRHYILAEKGPFALEIRFGIRLHRMVVRRRPNRPHMSDHNHSIQGDCLNCQQSVQKHMMSIYLATQ